MIYSFLFTKKESENEKWKKPMYFLGHLVLEVSSENIDIFQNIMTSVIYLYFGSTMKSCLLYWEEQDDEKKTAGYCPVTCQADYCSLRALSKKKTLMLMLAENSLKQGLFYIEIYLKEIFSLQYPSQPVHSSVNTNIQSLMKFLYGIEMPVYKDHLLKERQDVEALYSAVRSLQISDEINTENISNVVQHPLLVPTLRPYQRSAVNWMLEKEQNNSDVSSKLHPLFIEIQTPSQNTLYYNKYGGFFVEEKPLELPSYPGGILADEMGLGKTVEVLACILCHPWPQLNVIKHKKSKENDLEVISEICQAESETLEVVEPGTLNHHSSVADESNSYSIEEAAKGSENRVCSSIVTESYVKKEDVECYSCHDRNNSQDDYLNSSSVRKNILSQQFVQLVENITETNTTGYSDNNQCYANDEIEDNKKTLSKVNTAQKNIRLNSKNEKNKKDEFKVHEMSWEKVKQNSKSFIVDENLKKKQYFECICGSHGSKYNTKNKIQCEKCGLWQHPTCVKFNIDDIGVIPFYCPHCWVDSSTEPVESGATLIVSPASISYQWQEEIEKHIKDSQLRVLVYSGVNKQGFVQPQELATNYDIVLTTYETLRRKEIDYVDLPHSNSQNGRRLRHPKRYMAIPSPIIAVQWWRICLDEAQMVECATTKTAEMAQRLTAINRWCVTGTPVQKNINDLYGLLLFLGKDPYWVKLWWQKVLYEPYCADDKIPLIQTLSQCFWRNAKKNVLDQIGIPHQEEILHWLEFSPVENHFYKSQHQQCSIKVREILRKFGNLDIKLSCLDRQTMSKVLNPLRRLRQACCHPQAVRGQFLPIHKSTMTMEELLTSLIKKTKLECEEAHRQLIAALNGLAAIHIIQEELCEAAEKYREVLRSVDDCGQHLKIDKPQQIHALHNLAELLSGKIHAGRGNKDGDHAFENSNDKSDHSNSKIRESPDHPKQFSEAEIKIPAQDNLDQEVQHLASSDSSTCYEETQKYPMSVPVSNVNPPPGIGRTLRDESLYEEAKKLRSSYLDKYNSQIQNSLEFLDKATTAVRENCSQFWSKDANQWWLAALKHLCNVGEDEVFIDKIKDELTGNRNSGLTSVAHRFRDIRGLQYVLTTLLDELNASRSKLYAAVKKLRATPSQSDVNSAVDCHLRPAGGSHRIKCIYCKVHDLFNHYEGRVFCFKEDVSVSEPTTSEEALFAPLRRGTWADSELECILKILLNFSKHQGADNTTIEDGSLHIKLFENYKKEFRALRRVWMQIHDYASAVDEVDMATIRLRIRYPNEPKPDPPISYILEPQDVEPMKLKLLSERTVGQNELRKKLGQFFYLQNLAKADHGKKGGSNPELCPICQRTLGVQWSVLECGHSFCCDCIRILITEFAVGGRNLSLRCAVCRQRTPTSNISYIDTRASAEEEKISVKGSHSTKVEGVVRCLLQIKMEDPDAKSLVFSTWVDVLDLIGRALEENDVSFVTLHAHNQFQNNLVRFKYDSEVRALLLPVHSGANGLNLIEAMHVFLVEPILNPASEFQAIGRIHRIGQTKSTKVHRFIVQGTIEEKIHHALQPYHPSVDGLEVEQNSMTLRELQDLFDQS
ncbi:E3 ubiquitin-protein ligase SHPRH [Tachypleus tridentatus]|uniref:E3 ubiquitin-protein ligase SHPRH n=1 Tax=Tachypleus tridentatus TaxID=6853 RepID=UPI003FD1904E